jgi:hypothetical protein
VSESSQLSEPVTSRSNVRGKHSGLATLKGPATALALWVGSIIGGPGLAIAASGVGIAGAGELYSRSRRAGLKPQALLGLGAIVAMATVGYLKGDRVSRALVGVLGAAVIATFGEMLVRTDRTRLIETVLASLIPAMSIAVPVAYLSAMRSMPEGERLAGTVLLVVLGAELTARGLARLSGSGVGGKARGPSKAAAFRVLGGALGAAAAAGITLELFDPAISLERAALIGASGALAVAMSQPVATLIETLVSSEPISAPSSLIRLTMGLWLAVPMGFYSYLLISR